MRSDRSAETHANIRDPGLKARSVMVAEGLLPVAALKVANWVQVGRRWRERVPVSWPIAMVWVVGSWAMAVTLESKVLVEWQVPSIDHVLTVASREAVIKVSLDIQTPSQMILACPDSSLLTMLISQDSLNPIDVTLQLRSRLVASRCLPSGEKAKLTIVRECPEMTPLGMASHRSPESCRAQNLMAPSADRLAFDADAATRPHGLTAKLYSS